MGAQPLDPEVAALVGQTVSLASLPPALRKVVESFTALYSAEGVAAVHSALEDYYSKDATFDDPLVLVRGQAPCYRQFAALRKMTTAIDLEVFSISIGLDGQAPPGTSSGKHGSHGKAGASTPESTAAAPSRSASAGSLAAPAVGANGTPAAAASPSSPTAAVGPVPLLRLDITNQQVYHLALPRLLRWLLRSPTPSTTLDVSTTLWLSAAADGINGAMNGGEVAGGAAGMAALGRVVYHRDRWHNTPVPWRGLRRANGWFLDLTLRLMRL